MKQYQYQIIRYVHDHFTGEYVNVGVVLYSKEHSFLSSKTTGRYKRIRNMFPEANGRWIIRVLNHFDKAVAQKRDELKGLFPPSDSLEQLTSSIIARDNNAIQLTEAKNAIDIDLECALSDLFSFQVEKYIEETSTRRTLLDGEVWKTKYKVYFEKYGIEKKLTAHEIKIPKDVISFEKSWKNDVWHSYEPLSFVLQEKESIKDKVYKWAGKIRGLQQANEKLHLTLMTSIAPENKDLKPFIYEYLKVNTEKLKVDIVTDDEAERLARKIKAEMEEHDRI